MAYFDNYRRRRQGLPTVEDYQKVFSAYQELAGQFEVQGKELHRLQQELQSRMMGTLQPSPIVESNGFETEVRELKRLLEVKSQELAIQKEALHRSGEEARKMESELFFLRAGLEEAQKKLADGGAAEWQERYARLQAEVENLRRRWEQRSAEETAANRRKVLADMVPLADHLDLALQHKPAAGDQNLSAFISATASNASNRPASPLTRHCTKPSAKRRASIRPIMSPRCYRRATGKGTNCCAPHASW
jgi:uncharacterized protein YukE